jgi:hypothetical protein
MPTKERAVRAVSQPEKRMFKTWFGLTLDAVLLGSRRSG